MNRKLATLEQGGLSRSERRALRALQAEVTKTTGSRQEQEELNDLPAMSSIPPVGAGFWSLPIRRPYHRATGYQLAAANLFSAADLFDAAGPVMGIEKLSGGREFTFDPWELYLRELVSSPNLLIQGDLRTGKSFFIKRLIVDLVLFGRYAINTSDSKGEHGVVAEAIGGSVFKMGTFGSTVRMNPLERSQRRIDETEQEHDARVKAARSAVLQQIVTLLNPGQRVITARESSILDLVLDEVVARSGDHPTIREMWQILATPSQLPILKSDFNDTDIWDLRDGLRRLVEGDLAGMFDTHSSVQLDPECPYTVIDTFSINQRGNQALAVTQAVTNAWVHNTISNKGAGRRYFVIREEGWRDMKTASSLEAHQEQLKLSGEYGIAMVLIVHADGDFDSVGPEGSKERELAKSLLKGYANKICFRQEASTLEEAIATRSFTRAEANAIGGLKRGQFLIKLMCGTFVVDGRPTTTDWERNVFDTDAQMRARTTSEVEV